MAVVNRRTHTPTPDDVYIGRGSKWGNPFRIGVGGSRAAVISDYEAYIVRRPDLLRDLHELEGKNLVCFCAPLACHGDVLERLAGELSVRLRGRT